MRSLLLPNYYPHSFAPCYFLCRALLDCVKIIYDVESCTYDDQTILLTAVGAKAKVREFHHVNGREKNVLTFQIPMGYVVLVQVRQCTDELHEKGMRRPFIQSLHFLERR